MSANTVYCHILGGNVTVVTNMDGVTTNVVCPEYSRFFNTCDKKSAKHGFIGNVLRRTADKELGTRERFCEFASQENLL